MRLQSAEPEPASSPQAGAGAALRRAIADGYADLYAGTLAMLRKRRPGLSAAERSTLAHEALNEAVARALAKAAEYDPSRRAVPWVMRFVANVVREAHRAAGRRRQVLTLDAGEPASEFALRRLREWGGRTADAVQYGPVLDRALARLDEPRRRLLELAFHAGLNGAEVAAAMGLPSAGAARTAKTRAIDALAKVFAELRAADEERQP